MSSACTHLAYHEKTLKPKFQAPVASGYLVMDSLSSGLEAIFGPTSHALTGNYIFVNQDI